ncbi:MAG: YggT family protein [Actinobacteria bacterium]|jgi:uncharacterized protein YggT (Ycf19 family)|nr:YggT family protein [Ilumatobacteraceae bacterium]NBN89399.1 YggT family protein [Actinomycetota bacterium]NBP52977.1 YggT family protein [Actinomycetota bacterium]
MRELLCSVLNIYVLVIFVRIILSWFPLRSGGPMSKIHEVLWKVTEPLLGYARRFLPPLGGFDLSPIVVILALQFVVGRLILRCGIA